MKYKCISNLVKDGKQIMSEGDIVITRDNKIYNITTGIDYKGITFDDIVGTLVAITDEIPYEKVNNVPPTDLERFTNILNQMQATYKAKNHDYGNSFEKTLNEEGFAAARIRIGDKWRRFKNLSNKRDQSLVLESLEDTLLDMAVYSILTIMWMNKGK